MSSVRFMADVDGSVNCIDFGDESNDGFLKLLQFGHGRVRQVEEVFELISNMPIKPNQVVWRSFLAACRLHGNADLAEVAAQRVLKLEPEHCGNYMLMSNIYGAAGRYEEVAELRHTMRQQDVKKSPGCSWIELTDGMHVFLNGDRSHPEDYLDKKITQHHINNQMLNEWKR
ncbi:hypothetical protein BUALT_Bualt12G0032100 [Buddleja alternifolia]|uniref:Pentatricopeptide repeat-containing protein n=1 Tax=Buddleja alternifolia TaxID=168488 RepID=A0AAV6WWS0_9LAMI|nr:hypothetical protein BUALT_Bualt12G0032100 [Buddleja alternifolia]